MSHHIHCNDDALDEDVFNAFPFLRFDARLPRAWYHRWQHIYMWATFPLLLLVFSVRGALIRGLRGGLGGRAREGGQGCRPRAPGGQVDTGKTRRDKTDRQPLPPAVGRPRACSRRATAKPGHQQRPKPRPKPNTPTTPWQVGDLKGLFDNRTQGATLYGASAWERATVVLGKLAHFGLLLGLPWALHGPEAMLWGAAAYSVTEVGPRPAFGRGELGVGQPRPALGRGGWGVGAGARDARAGWDGPPWCAPRALVPAKPGGSSLLNRRPPPQPKTFCAPPLPPCLPPAVRRAGRHLCRQPQRARGQAPGPRDSQVGGLP